MIFIDLETTGLLVPDANSLSRQPHITEVYAAKLDEDFNMIEEFESLVNPLVEIEEHITKITGIDNSMVKDSPVFIEIFEPLASIFLGETLVIGANINFDMGVLYCELARIEKEFNFPYPITRHCVIEKTHHIKNKRMSQVDIHEYLFGAKPKKAHRAKEDVFSLIRIYEELTKRGIV